MKRGLLLLMLAWAGPRAACADAGVLVPAGHTQPDAKIFSLDEMTIEIRVDNGDARVAIRQIFGSHTAAVTEGSYSFALPSRAAVSDFAVWDDLTRIPGVILERRRAEEIYEALKQQAIDPGLLQQGEGDSGEARRSSAFTAKIVPIPGYGTKRIEIEYHERIPVENLRSSLDDSAAAGCLPGAVGGQPADHTGSRERRGDPGLSGRRKDVSAAHRGARAEPRARGLRRAQRAAHRGFRDRVEPRPRRCRQDVGDRPARPGAERDGVLPGFDAGGQSQRRGRPAQRRGPVRYVALHAVGKAGAQLSRARRPAARAAAGGPLQPAAVQLGGDGLRAGAPAGHAGAGREGAGVRESDEPARRHGSRDGARQGPGAGRAGRRRAVPGADRRWRRDPRHDPQCQAGSEILGRLEAPSTGPKAANVCLRRG